MKLKIAAVWFAMWLVTWPADLAYFQGKYSWQACRDYRTDLGQAMMFGMLPPAWVIVPFFTGFYEYGLQIFPLKKCVQP